MLLRVQAAAATQQQDRGHVRTGPRHPSSRCQAVSASAPALALSLGPLAQAHNTHARALAAPVPVRTITRAGQTPGTLL